MIRNLHDQGISASDSAILRVLEEVAARRLAGDDVGDDEVMRAHSDLMPDLRDRLHALRLAESARRLASDPRSGDRGHDQWESGGTAEWDALHSDTFHGYELREVVGRGAMGVVYRATQTGTDRDVAIKVMLQRLFDGATDQARFEREARVLGQLRHPNIVTIYDTGWSRGHFFLVMDYVNGAALDIDLRRRSLTLREKVALFADICEAVHAAHLRGVIHRDIKPSNILIDRTGRPHLVDFGLAKVSEELASSDVPEVYAHSMTMTGQFIGSLPWASPEQAEGAPDKVDIRTDVYSLGVVMYQVLAGKFPYSVAGNLRDVVDRILTAQPARLRYIDAAVPDEVDTIVLKCLSKERQRRYQSAGELACELRRHLAGEPIEAKRDSTWYVLAKTLRRHRIAAMVTSGIIILTFTYAATVSVFYRNAQKETQRAEQTLEFLKETLFQASTERLGSGATLSEVLDAASRRLEREFSTQPETEAALHYTLGSAYDSIWRKDAGTQHLRRALALYREVHGPEHSATVKAMVLLGRLMAEEGDAQSVPLIQEAWEIRVRHMGSESLDSADAECVLAFALWAANRPPQWEEAERHYEHALAVFRKIHGPEHADIARTMTHWGSLKNQQGQAEAAEILYRDACDMSLRLLGENHQFTIECRIAVSDLCRDQNRHKEASEILEDVLPHAERLFGAQSIAQIMRRRAYIQLAQLDYAAAEATLVGVQTAACDRIAAAHHQQAHRFRALATALEKSVHDGSAATMYSQSVDAVQEFESSVIEAARALIGFGRVRFRQERFSEAEPILRQCLTYLRRQPESQLELQVSATHLLARSLVALQRYAEAEEVLKETRDMLTARIGAGDELTKEVLTELIRLLKQTGRNEEARQLRAELASLSAS